MDTLVSTDENKEKIKTYIKLRDKIKDLINKKNNTFRQLDKNIRKPNLSQMIVYL